MRIIHTHNGLRLGDNLIQLNFLRRASQINKDVQFIHYYNPHFCNGAELLPFVEGFETQITISPASPPAHSIDSWRGPMWYSHADRLDFAKFHLFWFAHLAAVMQIVNPINDTEHLLIDYPLLYNNDVPSFDAVIINSPALSGQYHAYNEDDYRHLIIALLARGYSVLTTKPTDLCPSAVGHNVAWIGAVAANAKLIIGTSTGPSWPCLNVRNRDAKHILCLDTENVILTPRGSVARNVPQVIDILAKENFL